MLLLCLAISSYSYNVSNIIHLYLACEERFKMVCYYERPQTSLRELLLDQRSQSRTAGLCTHIVYSSANSFFTQTMAPPDALDHCKRPFYRIALVKFILSLTSNSRDVIIIMERLFIEMQPFLYIQNVQIKVDHVM